MTPGPDIRIRSISLSGFLIWYILEFLPKMGIKNKQYIRDQYIIDLKNHKP